MAGMGIRIAVVDDEVSIRENLQGFIARMAQETGTEMTVSDYPSGDALLENYAPFYDIIIFDIDMPGTNGMDAARKVREMDSRVVILFITNIAQYAINGYEVEAIDYIIKPIGYYDFAMKFQRAVRHAERSRGNQIVLNTVDGPKSLNTDDVLYVEVMAHYVIYHTAGEAYRLRASMKEHGDLLQKYGFARCHKSYLINLKHLKSLSASEVVVDTLSVPLGRAYKDTLMSEYMKYLRR